MKSGKQWVVGITHLVKPPFDPERRSLGPAVEFAYFEDPLESEMDPAMLARIDALLIWTPSLSESSIRQLRNCKIVVRYGVGYDRINVSCLERAGIAFSNNPEYGPEDVADTALAMLLGLQRRIYEHDIRCRDYESSWQENFLAPAHHSSRSTVGVVGIGRIGISVVNRLKPFGYRILGYDPYISNGLARAVGVERVATLEALFEESDMVTFHCPLTDETRGMVSDQLVNKARPGLVLVNTARGQLLESLDVVENGLRSGQLSAVGLDVLPQEPPSDHTLIRAWRRGEEWLKGRLLINPHNAFYSDSAFADCRYEAAETARRYLEEGVQRNAIP